MLKLQNLFEGHTTILAICEISERLKAERESKERAEENR